MYISQDIFSSKNILSVSLNYQIRPKIATDSQPFRVGSIRAPHIRRNGKFASPINNALALHKLGVSGTKGASATPFWCWAIGAGLRCGGFEKETLTIY